MGKVKRERQKYHLARAKSMNDLTTIEPKMASLPNYAALDCSLPQYSIAEDLFGGIEIPVGSGGCRRPDEDDDGRSVVTTKSSFKDRNLTKRQKREMRHDAFMRKLDVVHQARREGADRRRRQKTPVVGDMRSLADALPSIKPFKRTKLPHPKQDEAKQKCLQKAKVRHSNALRDIDSYLKVVNEPSYRADPSAAISSFIQEKIRRELLN